AGAEPARKGCALQDAVGRVEACPGVGCPFWEEGGAVLEAGCMIERLSLDLARRPERAQSLLELRLRLAGGPALGGPGYSPVRPSGAFPRLASRAHAARRRRLVDRRDCARVSRSGGNDRPADQPRQAAPQGSGIPFSLPAEHERAGRLRVVLQVLYL